MAKKILILTISAVGLILVFTPVLAMGYYRNNNGGYFQPGNYNPNYYNASYSYNQAHQINAQIVGTVTAINGTTITLVNNARTYSIDANSAKINNLPNPAYQITGIKVGHSISVFGTFYGSYVVAMTITDNQLVSNQSRNFKNGRFNVQLVGKVTSVSGSLINLTGNNSTSYRVDASKAKITKKSNISMAFGAIAVNDSLTVEGTLYGNYIVASRITDNTEAPVYNRYWPRNFNRQPGRSGYFGFRSGYVR